MVLDETLDGPDFGPKTVALPPLALMPIGCDYSGGQDECLPFLLFADDDTEEEDMDDDDSFDDMDDDFDDDFDEEDDFDDEDDDDYEYEDDDYDYEEDVDYDDFDE